MKHILNYYDFITLNENTKNVIQDDAKLFVVKLNNITDLIQYTSQPSAKELNYYLLGNCDIYYVEDKTAKKPTDKTFITILDNDRHIKDRLLFTSSNKQINDRNSIIKKLKDIGVNFANALTIRKPDDFMKNQTYSPTEDDTKYARLTHSKAGGYHIDGKVPKMPLYTKDLN